VCRRIRGSGFSLIEAAVVLSVVGLVIGGIWAAAATVQENRRQSRMLESAIYIINGIAERYRNFSVSYETFSEAGGVPRSAWPGIIPDDMNVVGVNQPVSPWGTPITINVTNDAHTIWMYLEVPIAACITLGPKIDFMLGKFGSGTGGAGYGMGTYRISTLSSATQYCNSTSSDGRVTRLNFDIQLDGQPQP
jgi:type II secretory pathway pseudopilin PulG